MLPRIKYRNPSVSIEINRHSDPSGPAKLNIYTSAKAVSTTPSASTTLSATDASKPAHSVDIRMAPESEILAQLVSRTNAQEIKATEEEEMEMAEIEEFKARSEKDRQDVKEKLTKERKEEELMKLARGEAAAA